MDKIFSLLFDKDEISWQSMIYELVRSEEMDPWDIDVSVIAHKFIQRLKKLKEMDLRISGKVILASAILLKIKSNKLMDEDINALDRLIASVDEQEEEGFVEDFIEYENAPVAAYQRPKIYPKTPQPRKRKVSVFDLVNALEKALEVKNRRAPPVKEAPDVEVPEKSRDITLVIRDVYNNIISFTKNNNIKKLRFTNLLPSETREDKIFTFIPLLHLDNQRKIDLFQEKHFGDIEIKLLKEGSLA